MEPAEIEAIARQLACPSGADGDTISTKMNSMNGFITSHCLQALNPAGGQTIAEIGPGNGALSEPLVDLLGKHGNYHAIERSADMAALTDQRLTARAAATVTVHCGDCANAPITTQSLDGVFAVNLLYFITDLDDFFSLLHGWLKPGGRAVFGIRSSHTLKDAPFSKYGFHLRGLEHILATLGSAGFTAIGADYHDEGTIDLGGMELPVDSLIIRAQTAA